MANSGWIFQFCFFRQVLPALDDLGRGDRCKLGSLSFASCHLALSHSCKLSETNQAEMTKDATKPDVGATIATVLAWRNI